MFCSVPIVPPLPQTMATTPVAISAKPACFCGVNASFKKAAARSVTMSGITPGKSAPACEAGANSKPAFASSTVGTPPSTSAATPIQPRRSSASPLRAR